MHRKKMTAKQISEMLGFRKTDAVRKALSAAFPKFKFRENDALRPEEARAVWSHFSRNVPGRSPKMRELAAAELSKLCDSEPDAARSSGSYRSYAVTAQVVSAPEGQTDPFLGGCILPVADGQARNWKEAFNKTTSAMSLFWPRSILLRWSRGALPLLTSAESSFLGWPSWLA